jgi:hypothetical protein
MASFNTRRVALGLPKSENGLFPPVPLAYSRLKDFVVSQVITQTQADTLWSFFSEELASAVMELPKQPTPPAQSRQPAPYSHRNHQAESPKRAPQQRQTFETHGELDDYDEDEQEGEDEEADDPDRYEDGNEDHHGNDRYYSPHQVSYR